MAYISTRGHGAPVDLQDLLVRGTADKAESPVTLCLIELLAPFCLKSFVKLAYAFK
tara:strand:- start:478 stop:645 length:168 start_codon:yes stop_codon:yes gene_type:complete